MELELNPTRVETSTHRNFFCPYYGQCLDLAASQYWEAFDCFKCKHQKQMASQVEGPCPSMDSSQFYHVAIDRTI